MIAGMLLFGACQQEQQSNPVPKVSADAPIQLHPENPHYFIYHGKTMALVSSAEHYGAVLNLDFDYKTYLKTMAAEGMNYTRIFTGVYFEIPGESFAIQNNSLAPQKNRVITPWAIVITDLSGETKYDLSTWNESYFSRLKDFMTLASSYDIIVEVTLFSSIYRDQHWDISPQNPRNNININHELSRADAQTLNNGSLLTFQENFVRKMVRELNSFDNVFFEIQNEPWSDHTLSVYNIVNKEELKKNDWSFKADFANAPAMEWQEKIAEWITSEESGLDQRHLIAQNYTNYKAPIPEVSENISIINFHYAWPEAVEWNYHFNKVIGFDESGFAGSDDKVYRRQAWRFMLSGGGLFNNLDYSFYVGHENGTGKNEAPGGGSANLRKQLKILADFLHSFELEKMHPDASSVLKSPGLIPYVLSDGSQTFSLFLQAVGTESTIIELKVPDGEYQVQYLNTVEGTYSEELKTKVENGVLGINIEIPEGELGVKVTRL